MSSRRSVGARPSGWKPYCTKTASHTVTERSGPSLPGRLRARALLELLGPLRDRAQRGGAHVLVRPLAEDRAHEDLREDVRTALGMRMSVSVSAGS